MPTNRDNINRLERQPVAPEERPTSLEQLNAVLHGPERTALVLGPIQFAQGLPEAAGTALVVPLGHELVVTVGQRLREILPAGRYESISWAAEPDIGLYLVDVRERRLVIETKQELCLSYPHTVSEDILFPHDLSVALAYRVTAPDRLVFRYAQPLQTLYDAALAWLLQALNGLRVDRLEAPLQTLPGDLRTAGVVQALGITVTTAHLVGRPVPTPFPELGPAPDPVMITLQQQIKALLEREPPLSGILQPLDDSYLVSVGLIDKQRNVLLLRFRFSQDFPHKPPRLTIRLNETSLPFNPTWVEQWQPTYTLGDLIDTVIKHFS